MGPPTNATAYSCRMYNFYNGANNPTTCAPPSAGTHNNGNVWGYYYTDNVNALSHTATYHHDAVNRLTSAGATGAVGYSQTYTYTGDGTTGQFGNLGCTPAGPGCVSPTYSAATNQVTNYYYSSAGNPINDNGHGYDWDSDFHMTQDWVGGDGGTYWYNGLGQRMLAQNLYGTEGDGVRYPFLSERGNCKDPVCP